MVFQLAESAAINLRVAHLLQITQVECPIHRLNSEVNMMIVQDSDLSKIIVQITRNMNEFK